MRLTSCHESTSAGRALKLWDEQLDGLMQIIAGTRSMDCLNRGLAALPACQGGLGIMTTADLADPCFIAGKLSVARSLTNCGPVDLSLAVTSLLDLSQTPKYATETEVHSAISRIDELKPGLADKLIESDANATIRHQHTLVANLAEARKADFLAGSSMQTRALVRSNAGNPHALASAQNRSPMPSPVHITALPPRISATTTSPSSSAAAYAYLFSSRLPTAMAHLACVMDATSRTVLTSTGTRGSRAMRRNS